MKYWRGFGPFLNKEVEGRGRGIRFYRDRGMALHAALLTTYSARGTHSRLIWSGLHRLTGRMDIYPGDM